MSRYLVDKFLYMVDADQDLFERYRTDPGSLVERWEREDAGRITLAERIDADPLTPEERTALATHDWPALYAMGAHPFILWILFYALRGHPPELRAEYRKRVATIGRPDFAT